MKYRFVEMVNGRFDVTVVEAEKLEAWLALREWSTDGVNQNKRQRAELQGQPIIYGMIGPMWDGDAVRYEDAETHAVLSN